MHYGADWLSHSDVKNKIKLTKYRNQLWYTRLVVQEKYGYVTQNETEGPKLIVCLSQGIGFVVFCSSFIISRGESMWFIYPHSTWMLHWEWGNPMVGLFTHILHGCFIGSVAIVWLVYSPTFYTNFSSAVWQSNALFIYPHATWMLHWQCGIPMVRLFTHILHECLVDTVAISWFPQWASCQIRKIAGRACRAGNAEIVFPATVE